MTQVHKVAHVMRRFTAGKWGGTESVVFNLAREFENTQTSSPIFCTDMFSQPGEEVFDTVTVKRFPYVFPWLFLGEEAHRKLELKGGSPLSLPLLFALRKEPKVSIIHTHVQHRLGGTARTVARMKGIPYVVSIHGGHFTLPAEQSAKMQEPFKGKPEWGKAFGFLLGAHRTLEDADAIICVGQNEHEQMRKRFPRKACYYVPNGVQVSTFRDADPSLFRDKYGFGPNDHFILCLSRIDYQKNQLLLVKAFARFAARHPEYRLVLVGPVTVEAYHEQILEEVRHHGLEDRVLIIKGFQPGDPVLPSAYRAADMFVLPTAHEPFGIVILEAWAAGTPAIATRIGGIPGFTKHEENILLFDLNDEDALLDRMEHLASDPILAGKLSENAGREVEARYDWSMVAARVKEIYADCIKNKRGQRT